MMRHRFIFGLATLALCAAATHADSTTMISGDLDSVGAGGSPPKGDSNHVAMKNDNLILGDTGDKVKVDGGGILAVDEGARDIGDTQLRDEMPVGTFMSDKPDYHGDDDIDMLGGTETQERLAA